MSDSQIYMQTKFYFTCYPLLISTPQIIYKPKYCTYIFSTLSRCKPTKFIKQSAFKRNPHKHLFFPFSFTPLPPFPLLHCLTQSTQDTVEDPLIPHKLQRSAGNWKLAGISPLGSPVFVEISLFVSLSPWVVNPYNPDVANHTFYQLSQLILRKHHAHPPGL